MSDRFDGDDHNQLRVSATQENGDAPRKRPYVRPVILSESSVSQVTGAGIAFELEAGFGGLIS